MIMMRDAVSAGAGAALQPHFLVAEDLTSAGWRRGARRSTMPPVSGLGTS